MYTDYQMIASKHLGKRQDNVVQKFRGATGAGFSKFHHVNVFTLLLIAVPFVIPHLVRVYRDWTLEA